MMPLEFGSVNDDRLVCGYHGLTFDTNGVCVEAPTSASKPDCALTRFPVREVGPLVWIWLGDQALAEKVPLPDQEAVGIGVDGWLTQCVHYYPLKARYALLFDNLFDLSHLGFMHASLVGTGGLALVNPKIEDREGRLAVVRTLANVPPDCLNRFLFPDIGDVMTTQIVSEFVGVSLINAGGPTFNGADVNAPVLGNLNFLHGITPESETATHYWIMMTRDFRIDDTELSTNLAGQNKAVVDQDWEALEAIERLLERPDRPREVSMLSDAGALRARAHLIQMIRKEQDVSETSPPTLQPDNGVRELSHG
jgi:vanillate O-demethylase monooxygenase subunit